MMKNVGSVAITLWVLTYALQANAMAPKPKQPAPTTTATASAPVFQVNSSVNSSSLQSSGSLVPQAQSFAVPPKTCAANPSCAGLSGLGTQNPPSSGCGCACNYTEASGYAAAGCSASTYFNITPGAGGCGCQADSCSGSGGDPTGTWVHAGGACCGSGASATSGTCSCSGSATVTGHWGSTTALCCGSGTTATNGACPVANCLGGSATVTGNWSAPKSGQCCGSGTTAIDGPCPVANCVGGSATVTGNWSAPKSGQCCGSGTTAIDGPCTTTPTTTPCTLPAGAPGALSNNFPGVYSSGDYIKGTENADKGWFVLGENTDGTFTLWHYDVEFSNNGLAARAQALGFIGPLASNTPQSNQTTFVTYAAHGDNGSGDPQLSVSACGTLSNPDQPCFAPGTSWLCGGNNNSRCPAYDTLTSPTDYRRYYHYGAYQCANMNDANVNNGNDVRHTGSPGAAGLCTNIYGQAIASSLQDGAVAMDVSGYGTGASGTHQVFRVQFQPPTWESVGQTIKISNENHANQSGTDSYQGFYAGILGSTTPLTVKGKGCH